VFIFLKEEEEQEADEESNAGRERLKSEVKNCIWEED
jgi:hypothetical protein